MRKDYKSLRNQIFLFSSKFRILMHSEPQTLLKQKGQSLLEAIVTLAIALAIVTSIVSLANKTNARSTNARQATQASKLAQEGLEIIRNIRDVDAVAVFITTITCTTGCSWHDLYTRNMGDPTPGQLQGPPPLGGCAVGWCLRNANATENSLLGIFSRRVELYDDLGVDSDGDGINDSICSSSHLGANQTKRVEVVVEWDSPFGTQQRTASTCITNWRN